MRLCKISRFKNLKANIKKKVLKNSINNHMFSIVDDFLVGCINYNQNLHYL